MNDKRIWIILFLICLTTVVFGQTSLDQFNQDRLSINENGMLVLGSWALINLISSPILAQRSEGSARYFHQMNGYWNSVNLVIAGFGYYSAISGESSMLPLAESLTEQFNMEKILLFNAGLDLAYIAGGFYLQERSKNTVSNRDRLKGFGQSLILQGSFLLVFDLSMYLIHHRHSSDLLQHIDQLSISPVGFGMIWRI